MRTFRGLASIEGLDELVEEKGGVERARRGLGVELDAHERTRAMADTLIGTVVEVAEPRLPVARQALLVDRIAVVLRGDEAPGGAHAAARLVLTPMAELELVGIGASGQRQDLVAQAHAQDRSATVHGPAHVVDRGGAHLRIARTV